MNRKYNSEHVEFISSNIKGTSFKELTAMFNQRFGMVLTVSAVTSLADHHGLHNEVDSRLNKGYEPTQFKAGNRPWNYLPIGSERIDGEGYVGVKIADPNKWKTKHTLIWETMNGPVPKGHVLIFGDGNKLNFELDNLILVSRKQLVRMNQHGLIQGDADLTRTGVIIADICNKIGERKRKVGR